MLRNILVLVLLFVMHSASAITCHLQTIETDYNSSTIVFYGKYVGAIQSSNFYNYFGDELRLDNFIIYNIFKTVDSAHFRLIKKFKLKDDAYKFSLLLDENDLESGYYLDSGSNYLVYAYFDSKTGFLTTNGCTRTRKILNDNFISNLEYDKDKNKDEFKELLNFASKDSAVNIRGNKSLLEYNIRKLTAQIDAESEKAEKYKMSMIISVTVSLISIAYIFRLKTKKPG